MAKFLSFIVSVVIVLLHNHRDLLECEVNIEHNDLVELFRILDHIYGDNYDSGYFDVSGRDNDGDESLSDNPIPGDYAYIEVSTMNLDEVESQYADGNDLNTFDPEEEDNNYSADRLSLPSDWDDESEEDDDHYSINDMLLEMEDGYDAEEEEDYDEFDDLFYDLSDQHDGDELQRVLNDRTGDYIYIANYEDGDISYSADELSLPTDWGNDRDSLDGVQSDWSQDS